MSHPKSQRARATAATALIGVLLSVAGCSAEEDKPKEPARLPDVSLTSLDTGERVDLASMRGPMVVNLWASWCTVCRRELPLFQAYAEKYDGEVDVVGIDFQETNPDRAEKMVRETGVKYPLYEDPDGELRARGLPKVILLDEQGRVAYDEYVEITSVGQLEKLVAKHLGAPS